MSSPTINAATRSRTMRTRNSRLQGQGDVLAMARKFVNNRFFRDFNVDAFVYLVLSLSIVPPLLNWVETAFAAVSLAYGLRLTLAAVLLGAFDKYLTCPTVDVSDGAADRAAPATSSSASSSTSSSASSSPSPRFFVPRLLRQVSQLVYHAWFVHAFAHRAAAAGNVGLGNLSVLVDMVAWTVWGHLCLQDHHTSGSVEDPKPVVRPLMWALFGGEALVAVCACLWPDSAAYALTQALLTMTAGAAAGIAVSSSVDLEHNAPQYAGIGLVFLVQCALVVSPAVRTVLVAAHGGPVALEHVLPFSTLLLLCLTSLIRDRLASATYRNPWDTVSDSMVRAAIVLLPLVLLYSVGHALALVLLVLCLMQQTGKEYVGPLKNTDPMELARKLLFAM